MKRSEVMKALALLTLGKVSSGVNLSKVLSKAERWGGTDDQKV